MIKHFFNSAWQKLLYRLHKDMLDENALYEELALENELKTDEEIGEMFEYHRTRSAHAEVSARASDTSFRENEKSGISREPGAQNREGDYLP